MCHCFAIQVNGHQATLRTSLPAAKRFANRLVGGFTNVMIIDLDRATEYVPRRRPGHIEWSCTGWPVAA